MKEGYLHAALEALDPADADSGKHFGRILAARTSCWMITKDLPCGSQVIISEMLGSERIRMSL